MKFPKITLLITTYNWTEALERVLDGVRQQTVLPDEVVIADDGSCTDTKDYIDHIRNIFPVPIQHVWHEDEGFRRTIILNKAIAASKGDYIRNHRDRFLILRNNKQQIATFKQIE